MFQISLKLKLRRAARPTVDGRSRQLVKSASVLLKLADCFQPSIASTGSTLIDPVPPFALPLPATAKPATAAVRGARSLPDADGAVQHRLGQPI
jgi:hypothetical protein